MEQLRVENKTVSQWLEICMVPKPVLEQWIEEQELLLRLSGKELTRVDEFSVGNEKLFHSMM